MPVGRQGGFNPRGVGGIGGTGQPGALRLFTTPLSKEVSWLLPFGLLGAAVMALRSRPRWPLGRRHQALVLWGGWLLVGGAFFSVAGFFHEYYLAMLGAPLAALVGIGAGELWAIRKRLPWLGAVLLLAGAAATLRFRLDIARVFTTNLWWRDCRPGACSGQRRSCWP